MFTESYEADQAVQVGLNLCGNKKSEAIVNRHNGSSAQIVCTDLLEVRTIQIEGGDREVIRHDPHKLSRALLALSKPKRESPSD